MKSRIALLAAFAVLLTALVTAPAANAASKKISVTIQPAILYGCIPVEGQLRAAIEFKAKVKRKNVPRPSRVTVEYKMTDTATATDVLGETLTLKPTKYTKIGSITDYAIGGTYTFWYQATYKALGKRRKITHTQAFTMPSAADLATMGVPACPPPA